MFVIVCGIILLFEELTGDDDDDSSSSVVSDYIDPLSVFYAIVQQLIGTFNEYVVTWITDYRNYRYKYEYNDSFAFNMFIIEFINYYIPMGF